MGLYLVQLHDASQLHALKEKVKVLTVNEHLLAFLEASPVQAQELAKEYDVVAVGCEEVEF